MRISISRILRLSFALLMLAVSAEVQADTRTIYVRYLGNDTSGGGIQSPADSYNFSEIGRAHV